MTITPKISIITPSFNQGHYIEQTIISVLNQNYSNLEYFVIDGGSTDQTITILKKYEKQLTWISEKDNGQVDAINKGLRMASGSILAFLNSDDVYEPGTLSYVGNYFVNHSDAMWFSGQCLTVDEQGKATRNLITRYKNFWLRLKSYSVLQVLNYISQPSTFWRNTAVKELGYLDESLFYTMDYEYWLRLGSKYPLHTTTRCLSQFRLYSQSKSGSTTYKQFDEEIQVARKYTTTKTLMFLHKLHRNLTVSVYEKNLNL